MFRDLSYDPPADVLHHIQYQQRTEHYVLLPEGANVQALNALERLSLIPQNEFATVDEYADTQGFTYTFLAHTWDSTAHEWMLKRTRTMLSPYGVRAWDQENQLISATDATPEALAAAQERQADVLEHGILDSPDFTPPTEAQVEALIAAGVEVAWDSKIWYLSGDYIFNFADGQQSYPNSGIYSGAIAVDSLSGRVFGLGATYLYGYEKKP